MEVYAIGHSNYPFDKLIDILKKYDINCVVDIRQTPYSKYNTQYNREVFSENLKELGFTYIYMGKEFGATRQTKDSYTPRGYADFEKAIHEDIFKEGVNRLKKGCSMGYRIVLLGAMQEPIRCHRAIMVGRQLSKDGFDIKYIMHEGHIEKQTDIEEALLDKYFESRNQLSIDSILGNGPDKEELINEGYKLANKEIGYRTENLKD
ncbi:MAG: DUF488 family protein [Paraclostridium sp.]